MPRGRKSNLKLQEEERQRNMDDEEPQQDREVDGNEGELESEPLEQGLIERGELGSEPYQEQEGQEEEVIVETPTSIPDMDDENWPKMMFELLKNLNLKVNDMGKDMEKNRKLDKEERRQDMERLENKLTKIEENRKVDMEKMEEKMVHLINRVERRLENNMEKIRKENKEWKGRIEEDLKVKDNKIDRLVEQQEGLETRQGIILVQVNEMNEKVKANSDEIDKVRKDVEINMGFNIINGNEERRKTEKDIEDMKKMIKDIQDKTKLETGAVKLITCRKEKIHKFKGKIQNLHPVVFIKSMKRIIKDAQDQ